MRYARSLARAALAALAIVTGGLGASAVAQSSPRALVYCPVGIDTGGCDNIVAALGGAGSVFSGGVDRGWDGTSGTVDLASADLTVYTVFLVPSLADGAAGRPYDRLRSAAVAGRLKTLITGRQAIWSGTPDLGTAGVAEKTTLLQSLTAWAAGGSGTGLVALLDGSDSTAQRYDWVAGISALAVVADSTPGSYAAVLPLTATGTAIVAPGGQTLAYTNMAAFGLHAGSGTSQDAADSASTMPVLVTTSGAGPATATTPAPTGLRALVYCPAADAGGCDNIVAALTAAGTPFAGGADRGYDGSTGTVDLRTADLSAYGVFVVPSLADGTGGQPYAVLRDPVVAGRLKPLLAGPVAVWSGTPDLGDSSRAQKNILITNLAKWAAAAAQATAGARGVVALQDASDSVPARYSWLSLISRVSLAADTTLDVYSNVQALTPTAATLLNDGSGLQLGYTNMASFGLVPGAGLGADGAGGRTSAIVLATSASVGGAGAGFATVTTDREDYQPGDTITVTGAGWSPGETVSLLFHEEVNPPIHPDKTLTAVADANGHILNHQYGVESTDVGVRFALTATGQTSGRTAQATFTDAAAITIATATVNGGTTTNVVVGQSITVVVTTGAPTTDTWAATQYSTLPATTTICVDHPDHAPPPPATETFTVTAPSTPNTYSALLTPYKNACNGGGNAGPTKTLTGAIVVAKGSTTPTVASSANPSVFGQSVTFTATVAASAPATGTPTGTVTFKDGAATLGTGTLNASGQATFSSSTLSVSSHSITVVYAGDASYNASTSPALSQSVNQASTSTALSSSANPSKFGQAVTFTATVTAVAPGTGTPTGTVQFKVDGANLGSPVALNVSGVATSSATSSLSVGSHPVEAGYSGATNYAASTSTVIATQVVQAAATTTTITSDTPDPSAIGQAVTVNYAVAVTSPGAGTPTGNVTVSDGTDSCTGTVAAGTCSIALNTAGARTLTATYAGDGNFTTSTSAGAAHQVNQIVTTTAVASSLDPSTFGQSVTFTATVTSGVNPVTVGSVTFIEGGTCAAPTTTLQTAQAVNGSGQVTFASTALTVGSHTVVACYGASGSFAASSGNVVQTVNVAPTTLTVASATGPFGGTAALSANLIRTAGGPISGKTVTFTLNGSPAGSATTDASGVATVATASLTGINAGSYPAGVGAGFAGDASYATSNGTGGLTVNQATVTVTVTVIPASIAYGALVELDAGLSPGLSGKTISFSIDGTPVGTALTNGAGKAKLMNVNPATAGISVGSHTVTATFPAEQNYATASGTGSLTITQAATTTAVTSSLNPSTFGQAVTFTATVTSAGGTPTGSATFIEGGTCASPTTTLQAATPLDGTGKATFATSALTAVSHTVTACFAGSTNFGASDGNVAQTVNKATPTVTWATPADITYGTALSVTQLNATASVPGSFTYTPAAGTVLPAGNGQTLSVGFTPTDATDYNSVPSTTVTINVLKRSVTPSITASNKPYDGTTAATIATRSLTGVFGTDDVSLTGGTATFDTKNVGTGKTVTATGLALAGTTAGNYVLSSTTASTIANITPVSLTGHFTANSRAYDGTTAAVIATRTLTGGVISGDVVTLTGGTATFDTKTVGTGKTVTGTGFTLSGADAGNYVLAATSATTTADITPASLTPSITASPKVYDGTTAATIATRSVAVVLGSDVVTLTGGTATFDTKTVGTGKTVTGTGFILAGADAGNYVLAATSATTTADITPASLTPSITASPKVYDGTTAATIATRSVAVVLGSDVVSLTGGTASFADKHVGTAKTVTATGLSLSGADAGNYVLAATSATTTADITPASLTPSITASPKVYDGTTAATIATRSVAVVLGSDVVSLTGGTASFADKHVGTAKTVTATGLSLSGADAGNYVLATTSATTTADITPASLTPSITASPKVYDGTTAATIATRSVAVVLGSDVVTLTGGTATFDTKTVGTGKTVTGTGFILAGADAGNYVLAATSATTTADITPASLTPSITASPKVYDGTTAATIATRSVAVVLGSDVVSLTGGTASFADKHVGTAKTVTATGLSLSGADAGNYVLAATSATTTADITPASLTPSITASPKVYDGTTAATIATRSVAVVLGSDVVSLTGGTASFADKHVGTAKTVTATGLSLSGADAGNYVLATTSATTTADITPASLTPSITASPKVYDGTTAATIATRSVAVVLGSDVVTLTGGTATFDTKTVGTGKTVTGTGFILAGADAGNYVLAATSATTTADITPASLTPSITASPKVYDGTTAATIATRSVAVVLGSDVVSLTGGTASFADKHVGTAKTVTATGLSLSGADAGNYVLATTSATTTADITQRVLTVAAAGIDRVYDATTAASVTLSDDRVSGDLLSITYTTASFADKNVGTAKHVSIAGIAVSGTDAGNYSFNTTASTTAAVTPRALTVTATGQNKVYDANTSATVVLGDDHVAGDVLALAYTSASFANKTVGTAKPVSVSGISISGTDAGNYAPNTTASATADITPASLAVTATGINRVYDATMAATVTLAAAPLASDAVTLSYVSASFSDKNVGTAKPVTVTGISLGGMDGGNYQPNTSTSTTANITALGITGSITASNKVYDATTAATIATRVLTGVLGSDVVSYTGGTATFANKNVGTGKTVTATGLSLSGADAGNYTVSSTATAPADITVLGITGNITASNKIYDATSTATILTRTLTGVIAPDVVSYVGGAASFATPGVGTGKTVTATGLGLSGADAANYTVNSTATTAAGITAATSSTLVTSSPLSIPYSDGVQSITLSATVASPTVPAINEGAITFTVKNASNVTVGTASAPINALGGSATTTYTVPGMTDVGTYTIQAAFAGTNFGAGSTGSGTLTVQPADFQATTATTDADFRSTDDIDVLFKSDPKVTTLQLKNTNPGTIHYQLTYNNVTGVDINAANGATLRAVIEVPPMTNCGGVACAPSVDKTVTAWSLKGANAVHVWPDDHTDDMPVQFTYKATGDCSVDGGTYTPNLSSIPSAAPKCIMVTGFAIPKKHRARLDLHLEFLWKESSLWAATPDPKLYFYSGFAFKATSTANFPSVVPSVRQSYQSAGIVAAGQRVTATGGFIFDAASKPAVGYDVRLFNLATDASAANACATGNSNVVADGKVSTDGFWFIWKTGYDQGNAAAPSLPSKVQYSVAVCSPGANPASVATRTMSAKMPDKEFDEEDFALPTVVATGP